MKRTIVPVRNGLLLAGLVLLSFLSRAEGGVNLTPGNNGITNYGQSAPLNNTIGFLQNGDNAAGNNYTGYFLYARATTNVIAGDPVFTTDHRLKVRMKPGETLYYGLRRTDGVDNVTIRIMGIVAGVETVLKTNTLVSAAPVTVTAYGAAGTTVGNLNAAPGVIGTRAQMNAGPAAVVGAAGYNALSFSLPASFTTFTDVWVELLDDAGGVSNYQQKDVYDLWDFSVYQGTTLKPGRLHSKFWAFQAMNATNRLSDNFVLYPAIPDDAGTAFLIKGLNLRGMQPFGFSFACNATGTLTDAAGNPTTDPTLRRKSKNTHARIRLDVYPQYDIFLNDPDIEFWPTGSNSVPVLPFTVNTWCADPATGRGALSATINFAFPANIQIFGELNGVPGYQPLSEDILFEVNRTSGLGQIFWDGRNGLGAIVPSGTPLSVVYRVQRYPVHFPIYDPENNDLGYRIEDLRPYAAGTTGTAYWDDTELVPGSSSLIGTSSASGVHPWGGSGAAGTILAPSIANARLMNTWSYGAIREVPLTLPYAFACNRDGDAQPDNVDIDDDNDGILDVDESNGIDPLLDADGDGIVNCYDIELAGYVDINFDGVNDAFDRDGEKIINAFDLDSDNDGITDVVEAYGVDAQANGRIDNYTDTDGDGLSQNVDQTSSGAAGSVGLGLPDLDGDGIPNYLDRDSDNDGIPDLIEAGGTDATNNGILDDLVDNNFNGMVEGIAAFMESFADADYDGLANSIDPDGNNDGVLENPAAALLASGTDTNGDGRADTYPLKNLDGLGRPNAYDLDSDDDGITDVREAGFPDANNNGTTDGTLGTDGWDDAIDARVVLGLLNTDGRGNPDYIDIDADDDGIPDNIEGMPTASYRLPAALDSDGDGLVNAYDLLAGFGGNGNAPFNMDGDALPDYRDLDTDNDTYPDIQEGNDFNLNDSPDDNTALSGLDTDGDGLDDRFDASNGSSKGTSLYMGNNGTTTGDGSPGSLTMVQQNAGSNCATERDWRCLRFGVLVLHRPPAAPAAGQSAPALALYPNPVTDALHIRFRAAVPGVVRLQLFGATGVQLAAWEERVHAGLNQLSLQGAGALPAGLYVLQVTGSGGTTSGRFTRR